MSGLFTAITNSLLQFIFIFGCFLAGACVLTLLSRWTGNAIRQSRFPQSGTYIFGWIGVPVHELSHAVFCKIFFHKVTDVKWFDPKGKDGAQGSVTHTYHPWNLYHRVGHFFIGLGPALLCPVVLGLLYWALVPGSSEALSTFFSHTSFQSMNRFPAHLTATAMDVLQPLKTQAALNSPGTWIFFYLSAAICTQVELSKEDIKQVATGIIPLLLIFFVLNAGAWAFDWPIHAKIVRSSAVIQNLALLVFGFASILALVAFAFCILFCGLSNLALGRPFGNPFRS